MRIRGQKEAKERGKRDVVIKREMQQADVSFLCREDLANTATAAVSTLVNILKPFF